VKNTNEGQNIVEEMGVKTIQAAPLEQGLANGSYEQHVLTS